MPGKVLAPAADLEPAGLEIRGLTKTFPNVMALDDVSLDVRPGEVLALIGENGAGKSTLLGVLGGEHVPDTGTVRLGGRLLRLGDPRAARSAGIRVVRQEPESFPGSTSPRTSASETSPLDEVSWTARRCGGTSSVRCVAMGSTPSCRLKRSAPNCRPHNDRWSS